MELKNLVFVFLFLDVFYHFVLHSKNEVNHCVSVALIKSCRDENQQNQINICYPVKNSEINVLSRLFRDQNQECFGYNLYYSSSLSGLIINAAITQEDYQTDFTCVGKSNYRIVTYKVPGKIKVNFLLYPGLLEFKDFKLNGTFDSKLLCALYSHKQNGVLHAI